ncbi:MAG: hypothetical protein LBG26_02280 [Treponema sp.]|jgi:hypothetical protein|nr:hypothetical protein [Treponema sp.]
MNNKFILAFAFFICGFSLFGQLRSFSNIYPGLGAEQREKAFSSEGLNFSGKGSGGLNILPLTSGNPEIASRITGKNPSYIVESLRVISGKQTGLLSIYNALGKIRGLKGRLYHSFTRDKDIPLFEDATRIESPRRMNAVNDPPPAAVVPASETFYARLKDVNFGNCYYRIALLSNNRSILCDLENFKTIYYGFFPVMKENNFTALLYVEPVAEGLLIYSVSAAEVSDFVAGKIDIPSALKKRLDVIIGWMLDGIG